MRFGWRRIAFSESNILLRSDRAVVRLGAIVIIRCLPGLLGGNNGKIKRLALPNLANAPLIVTGSDHEFG